MFHSCQLNKRINRLRERVLRLIYDDYNETFKKLFEQDRSCTINENNIQYFAIEMFKVKDGLVSEGFESMFVINNNSTRDLYLISVHQKSVLNILKKIQ